MTTKEINELLALAEAPFGQFRIEHLRSLVGELHRRGKLMRELSENVEDTSRASHDAHQVASGGVLHGYPFEECRSMSCEDNRDLVGRAGKLLS